MSLEKAEQYLEHKGMLDRVIRLKESTATVAEAAGDDHSAVRLSVDELEQISGRNEESDPESSIAGTDSGMPAVIYNS